MFPSHDHVGYEEFTVDANHIDIDLEIDVKIKTNADREKNAVKMQQVFNFSEMLTKNKIVPPYVLTKLFGQMMEEMEFPDIAKFIQDSTSQMPNGSKSIFEILLENGVPEDVAVRMAEEMAKPIMQAAEAQGQAIQQEQQETINRRKTLQRANEEAQIKALQENAESENALTPSNVGKFHSPDEISTMATVGRFNQMNG